MAKRRENSAFLGGRGHSTALHGTSSEKLANEKGNHAAGRRDAMGNGAEIGIDATKSRRWTGSIRRDIDVERMCEAHQNRR